MLKNDPFETADIWRWQSGHAFALDQDALAGEEPLEIRVRGKAIAVTMRTPGHDESLAIGFLLGEGLIRQRHDVVRVSHCPKNQSGNVVDVFVRDEIVLDMGRLSRHVFASSSCGLCGKTTIDALSANFDPVQSDVAFGPEDLLAMSGQFRAAQAIFDRTGGLHAAALFDDARQMVVVREDIGRHNAVDKVLGDALWKGRLPLRRHVLMVSGRASFEIMQKALAGGVAVVAAVSAPSSLAVSFAKQNQQTLVGFLRDDRMNVYACPERVGAMVDQLV